MSGHVGYAGNLREEERNQVSPETLKNLLSKGWGPSHSPCNYHMRPPGAPGFPPSFLGVLEKHASLFSAKIRLEVFI